MDPAAAENRRIRHTLRDLVAISALPVLWVGYDPRQLAESLIEVVLNAVKLDFVLLRLCTTPGAPDLEVIRTSGEQSEGMGDRIRAALSAQLQDSIPSVQCLADLLVRGTTARIMILPIGVAGECGALIAGSQKPAFPTDEERVLLNVAVNQAAMMMQRRRGDEAMREANARLQLAVNGSNIGIWEIDMPDGVFRHGRVDFTNVWEQLGYPRPASPTDFSAPMSLVHPHDAGKLEGALDEFLAGTTGKLEVEHRVRRSDGSYRWMLTRGVDVRDGRGSPIRLIGSSIDITQQKQTREELRQAKEAAEEANRMKDEFLATLSHELRTPLSAILVWGQMLAEGKVCDRDREKALRSIVASAQAQNQLIEDLLDISRMVSGKLRLNVRKVELGPVARAVVDIVQPMANARGVILEARTDEADPGLSVSGDPDRLQQVVWNLMTNAVKFTPSGGRVQLHLERADTVARVVVSDSGKGIAPQFLPYVFERFRQADGGSTRAHNGLGLGLAIIRELVQLHGGEVRAESAGLGRGATFTVELPLAQHLPDAAARPSAGPVDVTGGNEKPKPLADLHLLVAEDEPLTRDVLIWVLEAAGAHVTAVETAEAAIQALAERTVHVLISDIGMPGEDGYSLIQRIRRDSAMPGKRPIPAVALTAYARPEDRERAIAAGFEAFAPKPIKPAELIQTVARLGKRPG